MLLGVTATAPDLGKGCPIWINQQVENLTKRT